MNKLRSLYIIAYWPIATPVNGEKLDQLGRHLKNSSDQGFLLQERNLHCPHVDIAILDQLGRHLNNSSDQGFLLQERNLHCPHVDIAILDQ